MADDLEANNAPDVQADDPTANFVNGLFRRALKHCRKQHEAFRDADKFVSGDQWRPEDEAKLKAENRPVPVFNFTKRHINIVCGVEILNRLQPEYLPRVIDSDKARMVAELATGCHELVLQSCDGYFEISEAFRDLATRGMGFMKERLDLIAEPGGRIVWERIDGLHVVWDPDARKQNLEDSRYWIYFAKVPTKEAANEWPEFADYIKSGAPADYDDVFGTSAKVEQVVPPPYDPLNKYETDAIDSSGREHVIIKEAHWYVDEEYFEYTDPFEPQAGMKEMAKAKFLKFRREYETLYPERPPLDGVPRLRRVYKRAFVIGRKTMEESDAPCQKRFSLLAMTGEWDERDKVYRGLPHVLKDPQEFLNKYLSQTMHAIATSPKGILMFEDGAFENVVMAEEQWASWAPFIPMTAGALGANGVGKKFEYIPPSQPPQILFQMWQACIEVISQISGISQEMLTGGSGEVPGITMRQRQNVAMIAMAGYFNAYRRFLKAEAEVTFDQVQKFYQDDRVVRIGGPYDGQAVQLSQWRDDLTLPYDLIVDENPRNPNTREQYWEMLSQSGILPGLFKTGAIMQVPSVLELFPLPPRQGAELVRWAKAMGQQMAQAGQQPGSKQQPQKGRDDPRVIAANVAHRQSQTQYTQAKTQETLAKARALDKDSENKKLHALLDVMAATYEQKQKHDQHVLNVAVAHHKARREHFDSVMGALGGLNGAGA